MIEKIKAEAAKLGKEKPVVALMGLAFKPDIDDLRESPAVHIANALKSERGMDVLIVNNKLRTHYRK